jgi:hypothetical protein
VSLTSLIVLVHSILDLAFNAAAGAAAAATGALANGSIPTGEIVRLGALAGVIGSGVHKYCQLVSMSSNRTQLLMASKFGVPFVVTLAITQKAIATSMSNDSMFEIFGSHLSVIAPDSLLIAALAAGVPLMAGTAISWSQSKLEMFYQILTLNI